MKQVFTIEECKEIIKYAEDKNSWITSASNHLESKGIQFPNPPLMVNMWEHDFFRDKLKEYVKDELKLQVDNAGLDLMKYRVGDSFPRHKDRDGRFEFNMDFLYNVNVVLNDEFDGGEFYLNDELVTYNSPGMVYHYKSDIYHEVKEVTKGTRYSALFFIRDRDLKSIYKII